MNLSESNKKLGVSIDYGDFIVIRPKFSYRINSGVIIIKGDKPVLIDTGLPFDPGAGRIKKTLKLHNIDPKSIKYLIITHFHPDHSFNLYELEKSFYKSKVICHEKDFRAIQNPTIFDHSYDLALKLSGGNPLLKMIYSIFVPLFITFVGPFNFNPRVDYLITSNHLQNDEFDLNKCPKLSSGQLELTFLHCPGHSPGHISILDNKKNLYLGDFVPFTPWIDPTPNGLNNMIQSIKNILTLTTDDVHLAIRAHGDIRRSSSWEVSDWAEESENFKLFLEIIYDTLDSIRKTLKNTPMTINEITAKIIPKYLRYNKFMRIFYMPPSISWSLAYCLKLEKMGEISRKKSGRNFIWSA